MKIDKTAGGKLVESTIKSFSCRKDRRREFLAFISNNVGDTKYCAMIKKRINLPQNGKYNGRSYPLDTHVSNNCQAVDYIQ